MHQRMVCTSKTNTVTFIAVVSTVVVQITRIDTRYTLFVPALKLETEAVVCNETPLFHKKLV